MTGVHGAPLNLRTMQPLNSSRWIRCTSPLWMSIAGEGRHPKITRRAEARVVPRRTTLPWGYRNRGGDRNAGLERRRPKVIPVCLGEARTEVGDHARKGMSGVEARLGFEEGESVGGIGREHERVHDVLGRVIHSDEQTVFCSPG